MNKKSILIIFLVVIFIIAVAGIFYLYAFNSIDKKELNLVQKSLARSVLTKFEEKIKIYPEEKLATIDYDTLMATLNFYEKMFAEKLFSINPAELGFNGPFYTRKTAKDLIMIGSETLDGKFPKETGVQFLPHHIYNDYLKMSERMVKELGRKLYVDSGYRSPGRQAFLFLFYLVNSNNYSLVENAKWIAMPGYSEHNNPVNTAIDFVSSSGVNGFDEGQTAADFEVLPEYEWLLMNAKDYNFALTYPKDNKLGITFEPWHWHWEKSDR